MKILRFIALTMTALLAVACSSTPPAKEDGAKFASYVEGSYKIGVDDRLQVTVWKNPELSVAVPVRPDGKISVPLIGDVDAGGHTPEEVSELIRHKLASYLRDPNVTVILTDLRSHEFLSRVRITGAVRTPRSIPYRQGMTVLDAVLEAGGMNDFAAPNRTKLYRRDLKEKQKVKTDIYDVELGDIFNKGKLETNYPLLPGDVITVPERIF